MRSGTDVAFDNLVEQYLGERLPNGLATSLSMETLSAEAQAFIVRSLSLMQRSGYSVNAFSSHLIHWLAATVPSTLPGAWGGRIPPLTLPGRHKKLDDYIAKDDGCATKKTRVFVDVGCGFPPVTAADTAEKFTDWQILGVDRSFADYVLYDSDGHYACFDEDGEYLYFQAMMKTSGRALYADPENTRRRFCAKFEALFPMLPTTGGVDSHCVEVSGDKLMYNHIRDYETDNLKFIQSEVTDLELDAVVDVIRCMNVLIYYDPSIRKQLLAKIGELLADGGLLITGTNGLGIQTRYTIYRKRSEALKLDEFSFGLDNLGHIVFMPFFSIHENDPEALQLADLIGTLRRSKLFWPEFSKRQDELLNENAICRRDSNGFFEFRPDVRSISEYLKLNARIWHQLAEEGFVDLAVNTLVRSGYHAWKNSVGDIAIEPPADSRII
jgi:hypothetical protein